MVQGKRVKRKRKSAVHKGEADLAERRIARLEKLVDLMLQALLRGRLLPNERRTIKRHLLQRKEEELKKQGSAARRRDEEGPRCPACRLVIEDQKAEHCPHCSVLLAAARGFARKRKTR